VRKLNFIYIIAQVPKWTAMEMVFLVNVSGAAGDWMQNEPDKVMNTDAWKLRCASQLFDGYGSRYASKLPSLC